MKIGNHEVIHNENRTTFLPIYDLDGVCQDCVYLEKIRPLFEEKDKEIKRLNNKLDIQEKKFKKWNKVLNDENHRLNNIVNNANKVLQNILVINNSEHKGKYRPIKNTSKNDVYKSVCMLYGILGTPYRCDYGSLQELKGDGSNE